jgi:hypothetical protein
MPIIKEPLKFYYLLNSHFKIIMKKYIILTLSLFFLTACAQTNGRGFSFNFPDRWNIKTEVGNKITLNAYPKNAALKESDYPLNYELLTFTKKPTTSITDWVKENKSKLPGSSFEGTCTPVASSNMATISNCGRQSEDLFLVNFAGDKVITLFQGQDPMITPEAFLSLITFAAPAQKTTSSKESKVSVSDIRAAFSKKDPNFDKNSDAVVVIDKNINDLFVEGSIGNGVAGAMYWAAKVNGEWIIVQQAQDLVPCSVFAAYNFPIQMVEKHCYDEPKKETVFCTQERVPGLTMHIRDEKGKDISGAKISTSPATDTFTAQPDGSYSGLEEQKGNFDIYVTKAGYVSHQEKIQLVAGECHVISQDRTVTLKLERP